MPTLETLRICYFGKFGHRHTAHDCF